MQMWKRAAVPGPMVVNRTEIILQKRTGPTLENWAFLLRIVCEKPGMKLVSSQVEALAKAPDISLVQNRADRLAAVGALGAIDFPGYFPIDLMNRTIDPPNGKTRSLEKAAESPIGLLTFLRELLNSLDVGFELHMSESLPTWSSTL
jgi:hypothetical protein